MSSTESNNQLKRHRIEPNHNVIEEDALSDTSDESNDLQVNQESQQRNNSVDMQFNQNRQLHAQQMSIHNTQQQQQQNFMHMNAVHSMNQQVPTSNSLLTQSQLHQHQMAMAAMAHGLPLHIMARMSHLTPTQQQQFHIQHQLYMQKLQQLQQAQARGQMIPPQQIQMLQTHQHYLAMLVAGPNQQQVPMHPHAQQLPSQGANQNIRPSQFQQMGMPNQFIPPGHPMLSHLNPQQQRQIQQASLNIVGITNQNAKSQINAINGARQASVTQSPNSPTNDLNSSAIPQAAQKIPLPPWLQSHGEKRHSEKQLTSGADLSKTKKKYRMSLCVYCAKVYPQSPWATLKSRKFEHEIFRKHEKSNLHQRALLELNKSAVSGNPMALQVSLGNIPLGSIPNHGLPGRMLVAGMTVPMNPVVDINLKPSASTGSGKHKRKNSSSAANGRSKTSQKVDDHNTEPDNGDGGNNHFLLDMNVTTGPDDSQLQSSSNSSSNFPSQDITSFANNQVNISSHGNSNGETADMFTKSEGIRSLQNQDQPLQAGMTTEPAWLMCSGDMCHSDTQVASGRELSTLRKRYRKMLCKECAQFNPASPWATLKARLYEPDTLTEHAKSHSHTKAVIQKDLYMTVNSQQQQMIASDSSPSSTNNQKQPNAHFPLANLIAANNYSSPSSYYLNQQEYPSSKDGSQSINSGNLAPQEEYSNMVTNLNTLTSGDNVYPPSQDLRSFHNSESNHKYSEQPTDSNTYNHEEQFEQEEDDDNSHDDNEFSENEDNGW